MAIIKKTKDDSRIVLWLDRELIEILKNHHLDLNEELSNFFKYDTSKTFSMNTEITFDSFDVIRRMIQLLCQFNDQLNALLHNFHLFDDILVSIGIDTFYEGNDGCDEQDEDDNECDRLSAYYGALNEYRDNQKENIASKQKVSQMYQSVRKAFVIKKIEQIQKFYNIHGTELNRIQNRQALISFLINRIDNNRDIVYLLNHEKIYNKLGRPYTAQYIAKQRYKLKSSIK